MKQLHTTEKQIGNNKFYIRPFKAFVAANISAELISILSPVLGMLVPLMEDGVTDEDGKIDISNVDAEQFVGAATPALTQISGDKLEKAMKSLLIVNNNISVEGPDTDGSITVLNEDLANEIFCGELQDMLILCFEVIRINFKGFFKKLGSRFGVQLDSLQLPGTTTKNTESST